MKKDECSMKNNTAAINNMQMELHQYVVGTTISGKGETYSSPSYLGIDLETEEFITKSENYKMNELIVGSNVSECSKYAALPRVETEISKLASGSPLGLIILSDDDDLINGAIHYACKHNVPRERIHNLTAALTSREDSSIIRSIITGVLEDGGIIYIDLVRIEPFFMKRTIQRFLDHLSEALLHKGTENRNSLSLLVQSSEALQSEKFIDLLSNGRKYNCDIGIILNSLNILNENRDMILRNIFTITSYSLSDPFDRRLMGSILGIYPLLLRPDLLQQGHAYRCVSDPIDSSKKVVLVRPALSRDDLQI